MIGRERMALPFSRHDNNNYRTYYDSIVSLSNGKPVVVLALP